MKVSPFLTFRPAFRFQSFRHVKRRQLPVAAAKPMRRLHHFRSSLNESFKSFIYPLGGLCMLSFFCVQIELVAIFISFNRYKYAGFLQYYWKRFSTKNNVMMLKRFKTKFVTHSCIHYIKWLFLPHTKL